MALSPAELLEKATLTSSGDLGGVGQAPLTVEQVDTFLRLAILPQKMLPDVRTVTNRKAKWQESQFSFSGRILRPGTEAQRLADGDRTKPTLGMVEIDSVLVHGEVPVSDDVMEDQVEEAGFGDTVMQQVAEYSGRDLEELMINGDTANGGDTYLALLDGWVKQAQGSGGHVLDATSIGQDYQQIFKQLLGLMPNQWKRDPANMRYYVPIRLEEMYRDILAQRGTPLGDMMLTKGGDLTYAGYNIVGVPLFSVADGTPDTTSILFTHRMNLYAGFHRQIKLETFRDPREHATSFVVSARVDAKIGVVDATAIATNVNVEES